MNKFDYFILVTISTVITSNVMAHITVDEGEENTDSDFYLKRDLVCYPYKNNKKNELAKEIHQLPISGSVYLNFSMFSTIDDKGRNYSRLKHKNPYLVCGIEIFKDSYRAHLDSLRTQDHTPLLLQGDNYKYFLTVYDVIPSELLKLVFDVRTIGSKIFYFGRQENEIIRVTPEKFYDNYTSSNWIYFLLVNVLNQVKNSTKDINFELINDTANIISTHPHYAKYAKKLRNSALSLKYYFDELDLYKYLKRIRECISFDITNFTQNSIEQLKNLFEDETVELATPDYSWYTAQIEIKPTKPKLENRKHSMTEPIRTKYCIIIPQQEEKEVRKYKEYNLPFYDIDSQQKDETEIMMNYTRLWFIKECRLPEITEIVTHIMKNARERKLGKEEVKFLELWKIAYYKEQLLGNDATIHYRLPCASYYTNLIKRLWDDLALGVPNLDNPKEIEVIKKNLHNFLERMYEKYRAELGYRYYIGCERGKYEGYKK